MSDRISLVRWRDAKTDPPKEEGDYPTDAGIMFYDTGFGWQYDESSAPSVWCDPSPPGDDAPTAADLRDIATTAWRQAGAHFDTRLAGQVTRLRRAIEEAER